MEKTIYIVIQSQGEWSDRITWGVKAFTSEDVAKELILRLDESERLERIEAETSDEYMDYSVFYIDKVQLSDIKKT